MITKVRARNVRSEGPSMVVADPEQMTWMTLRYGTSIVRTVVEHRPGCPLEHDAARNQHLRWCGVCRGRTTLHFAPGTKVHEAR